MDHAEALEALELAVVEPGGVERLEAGDTPEAAVVAQHLVACPACRAEWDQLRATGGILRAAFRPAAALDGSAVRAASSAAARTSAPQRLDEERAPAELRDRTLRYVRELGRERQASAFPVAIRPAAASAPAAPAALSSASAAAPAAPSSSPAAPAEPIPFGPRAGRLSGRRWSAIAGLAAALVLAVGLGAFAFVRDQQAQDSQRQLAAAQQQLQAAEQANTSLADLADAGTRLALAPDARAVDLTPAAGRAKGFLVFSAAKGEVVMLASGLAPVGGSGTLRCWVDSNGQHTVLGDLSVESGGLAYWWGWPKQGLAAVKAGDRFGVSLVSADGSQSTQLLTGVLGS